VSTNSIVGHLPAFAVPQLINYQGVLTDKTTGDPITSPGLTMKFRIYDAETDGTKLWEESRTVPIESGIYNVILGAVTPVTVDLFSTDERWLEVEAAGEVFTPRQKLTSVAYAMKAGMAEGVNLPLSLTGSATGSLVSAMNTGTGIGIYAQGGSYGVFGSGTSNAGVYGYSSSGYGVQGGSSTSYAGYFSGDVKVAGSGKGIEFPDGTKQTTAATATGDITSVTTGTGLTGGGTSGGRPAGGV